MRPRAGLCSGAEYSVPEQPSHDQHDRELSAPLTPVMMTLVTMMMMFRPETEVLLQ